MQSGIGISSSPASPRTSLALFAFVLFAPGCFFGFSQPALRLCSSYPDAFGCSQPLNLAHDHCSELWLLYCPCAWAELSLTRPALFELLKHKPPSLAKIILRHFQMTTKGSLLSWVETLVSMVNFYDPEDRNTQSAIRHRFFFFLKKTMWSFHYCNTQAN